MFFSSFNNMSTGLHCTLVGELSGNLVLLRAPTSPLLRLGQTRKSFDEIVTSKFPRLEIPAPPEVAQ